MLNETDEHQVSDSATLVVTEGGLELILLAARTPNLESLTLNGWLWSLRDIGSTFTHLQVLNVAHCGLRSLDGARALLSLRELHAASNRVRDIVPAAALRHLQVLDLSENLVEETSRLWMLGSATQLRRLSLQRCPCAARPDYRSRVAAALPQLDKLDDISLNDSAYNSHSENSSITTNEDRRTEKIFFAQDQRRRACRPATVDCPRARVRAPEFSRPQSARPASREGSSISKYEHRAYDMDIWAGAGWSAGGGASPSTLTSGRAVCGGLARSLRCGPGGALATSSRRTSDCPPSTSGSVLPPMAELVTNVVVGASAIAARPPPPAPPLTAHTSTADPF